MEGFMGTNSEKLDLTLISSLSSMAGEKRNVAQEEGPIVALMERSASLPWEDYKGLLRFGDLKAMTKVETGRRLMPGKRRRVATAANGNPYGDPFHHGGGGGNSNTERTPNEDDTMETLRKMPTVTMTGGGRNGRKINGILYSYEKGEVSIVCVCHATFFSPSQFVKHAGAKQVQNPMKLITLCPNSF